MQKLLTMLESKYKRLEYIESTGTQYIKTGYIPNINTEFTVSCAFNNLSAGRFGRIIAITGTGARFYFGVSSDYFVGANSNSYNHTIMSADMNNHIFTLDKNGLYIDGELKYSNIGNFTENSTDLYLFATHDLATGTGDDKVNYLARSKVRYCTIKENGAIKLNLIPVLRKSDNEIGMLDLVEGKFYTNAGTGKFTANLDTMYALIQGTPTVQDGRVSGFTSSNYLTSTALDCNENFELNTVFITASNWTQNGTIITNNGAYRGGIVINSKSIRFQCRTTVPEQYILAFDTEATANTKYTVNCKKEGNTLTIKLYINDVLTETKTDDLTGITFSIGNNLMIGYGNDGVFSGTIDLNRSYIKIDDTKYKLQAVVGYSKVGTLTESPTGVFSGFSADNYLTLPAINMPNIKRLELNFMVNALEGSKAQNIIFRPVNTNVILRLTFARIYQEFRYFDNDNVSQVGSLQTAADSIDLNSNIYIRIIISNGFQGIYYSTNDNTYNLLAYDTKEKININTDEIRIGTRNDSSNNFSGKIYMSKSSIKINNKLWFNGLEA